MLRNWLMMMTLLVCMEHVRKAAFGKFYRLDGYLFREKRLCVPNSSMREAHGGGLMGHCGERNTLDVLHEKKNFGQR
jgi:hypothetical protein